MKSHEFTQKFFDAVRVRLNHGDNATQAQLDSICEELKEIREKLRPKEKDEAFHLVNNKGIDTSLVAPRWLCHFLGLRHRSVHILLKWKSPRLGSVFVLQVRNWGKSDSPGHLDISVGGHVTIDEKNNAIITAYKEMNEELGISKEDLIDRELVFCKGYEYFNKRDDENFYNNEWREIYVGEFTTSGFDKIRFNDKEVVGIYLCPEYEAKKLLSQKLIPIASALEKSLPFCL